MDEVTAGAVIAVWHADIDHARRWFDAVCEEYHALLADCDDPGWDAYLDGLARRVQRDALGAGLVDGFASYLQAHAADPMAVIAHLADPALRDELVRTYAHAVEQSHVE